MARSSRGFFALMMPRRRRNTGFESLEGRCYLSAAPLPTLPHMPGAHLAPFELSSPALAVESGRADRPVAEMVRDLPATPVSYLVVAAPPAARNTPAPFDESLLSAPENVRWNELPEVVPPPVVGLVRPIVEVNVSRITEPDLTALDRGDSPDAIRFFVWMPDSSGMGFAAVPPNFATDPHLRLLQLVRDSLFETGVPTPLPDGSHGTNDHSTHDDNALELTRRANPGSPFGLGQNVESGNGLQLSRLTSNEQSSNSGDLAALIDAPPKAVSHLVAFGTESLNKPSGRGSSDQVVGAAESTGDNLLLPRFAYDAEALRAALAGLVFEAEELGMSLMSILADMPIAGEAALVAGLLGAGTAYRYAREGRRRERADEQEVLRARFIDAPTSIRLRRKASA